MIKFLRVLARTIGLWAVLAVTPAAAQDMRALAQVNADASAVRSGWGGRLEMTLALTQAVPWRVSVAADPPRLIMDFREVAWQGVDMGTVLTADRITRVRTGLMQPGWSRLVAELNGPYVVDTAGMATDPSEGTAQISVFLKPATPEDVVAAETAAQSTQWARKLPLQQPNVRPRQTGTRDLRVVLDPGHGGIDSGAERQGLKEKDLMLTFARELQEVLLRRGGFEVLMTRTDDSFISLSERVSFARAVEADVFLSLHADAIAEGAASGATIYTLSENASDAVSARLAATHARDDLILGADLEHHDDEIARLLMELARREVTPRAAHLADALVEGIGQAVGRLHKRPSLQAEFVVLKAPDIPSALIEVGFMSDPRDLANLQNPTWRAKAALGIVNALESWAITDAAQALQLRQ